MTNLAGQKLVQHWADGLSFVLGQIAGKPFGFELAEAAADPTQSAETDVYLTITVAGAVRGEMSLRITQPSAAALAKTFLGEQPGASADLTADDRAAIEELLRQVAGQVCTLAKPVWQEIQLNLALAQAPTWPAAASGCIRSVAGAPSAISIEWQLSAALNTALTAFQEEQKPSVKSVENPSPNADPARLGFFMDLELEVTLRFGGCNILLKDVLQLGPGSVLELDRDIQDPADLLLDGKLIARGEVVVVDGNYGLRVSEILAGSQLPV